LTPGAPRTVEIIAESARPNEGTWLLDVAAGKGEAAATLAGRFACRVVAVEPYDAFVHYTAAKLWFYNLRDLTALLRADGKRLPLRNAAFDAAYCIGAPSIVGLDPAFREMARVTQRGGWVIASDVVWRRKPDAPLGPEWRWLAKTREQLSAGEYATRIEAAGLRVEHTQIHPRSDWEDYWRPMLEVAREAKTQQPADIFFADEIESDVALERRAVEQYIDYATFVARRIP
jgi:ubiquinone/menaquinone biosynthesis C-methylase UbiE